MFSKTTLKNGLTLITVPVPNFKSTTTLVAVGVGSRYEDKRTGGISHFLEHMFFKGSRKYPSTEMISSLVDGIGAVNNAATDREVTFYWIKSASKHVDLASDIVSSMLKEPLFQEEEVEREKGVIYEEMRMYKDNPARYVWDLYMMLQFGDTPIGRDIAGKEEIIKEVSRDDLIKYTQDFYSPENMCLVYAGKIPKDIKKIAEKYFLDLPKNSKKSFTPFKKTQQTKPKVDVYFKQTDQVNLVLGTLAYDRHDKKRYAARALAAILGEGMSSRLFLQVRERRGLAYHVGAEYEGFADTGAFVVYVGLKLEKVEEGLEVIVSELDRIASQKVTPEELKKAKEMIRGRLAIRGESTNFLAEYFGIKYALDQKLESFDEYLKNIDAVTVEEVQAVAKELFQKRYYNLQVIGPFKSSAPFEKILNN